MSVAKESRSACPHSARATRSRSDYLPIAAQVWRCLTRCSGQAPRRTALLVTIKKAERSRNHIENKGWASEKSSNEAGICMKTRDLDAKGRNVIESKAGYS
jgi:hypothetical protein